MKNKAAKLLREKGWTQAKLAKRWRLSKKHISNLMGKGSQRDLDAIKGLPLVGKAVPVKPVKPVVKSIAVPVKVPVEIPEQLPLTDEEENIYEI